MNVLTKKKNIDIFNDLDDLFKKVDIKSNKIEVFIKKKTLKTKQTDIFSYLFNHFNKIAYISNSNINKLRMDIYNLEIYYNREIDRKNKMMEYIKKERENVYFNYTTTLKTLIKIKKEQKKLLVLKGGNYEDNVSVIKMEYDKMITKYNLFNSENKHNNIIDKYSTYINLFNKLLLNNLKLENKLIRQKKNLQNDIYILVTENNIQEKEINKIIKKINMEEKTKIKEIEDSSIFSEIIENDDIINNTLLKEENNDSDTNNDSNSGSEYEEPQNNDSVSDSENEEPQNNDSDSDSENGETQNNDTEQMPKKTLVETLKDFLGFTEQKKPEVKPTQNLNDIINEEEKKIRILNQEMKKKKEQIIEKAIKHLQKKKEEE